MKVHDLDQMNIKHDLGPCTCREHVQLATATAQLAEARELLRQTRVLLAGTGIANRIAAFLAKQEPNP